MARSATVQPVSKFSADIVIPVLLGCFLIVFGLRQAGPALLLLPVSATIDAMREQKDVPPEALDSLISAERTSLALRESAVGYSDMGLALTLRARAVDNPKELLEQARDALTRSVALSPANPYAWIRLATVQQSLGADTALIAKEWRMAVMTGQNEERLRLPRIKTALGIWPELTPTDRANVFTDIRALWRQDKTTLLQEAAVPFSANVIRAALVVDLPELIAFEKALKEKNRK